MTKFFVPCNPPTSLSKNSKRAFKGFVVENPNAKAAKADIVSMFAQYAPKEPYDGAVKLSLVFLYGYPKSTPKKVVNAGGRPMVKAPDADGIAAGVMDAMTRLRFWHDDAQVSCLRVEKWQVPNNCGISVTVEPYKSALKEAV